MTGKQIAAVVTGLILSVAGALLVVNQAEVRGQEKEKKQQWEYKIIFTSTESKDAAKAMTEQYNALAAEGWEYVGPVVDRTVSRSPTAAYTGINGAFVVLKRLK